MAAVFGSIGALLSLAGIVVPTRLGPVERAWMGLARAISKVTTPIVMGIVYFLVVTPIGIGMRLLGRNPIARADLDGSFWLKRRPGEAGHTDLKHQF
jgi:hypothetical protein